MGFSPNLKPESTDFHLYPDFNTLFEPHVPDPMHITNSVLLDHGMAIKKTLLKKDFLSLSLPY